MPIDSAAQILIRIAGIVQQNPNCLETETSCRELKDLCRKAHQLGYHEANSTPRLTGHAMEPFFKGLISDEASLRLRTTWDVWLYALRKQ